MSVSIKLFTERKTISNPIAFRQMVPAQTYPKCFGLFTAGEFFSVATYSVENFSFSSNFFVVSGDQFACNCNNCQDTQTPLQAGQTDVDEVFVM